MTKSPKSVAVFISNPRDLYSGGRYFGLIVAEALAARGNEVFYVTNQIPIFWQDFAEYPAHEKIRVVSGWDKAADVLPEIDAVFVVPGTSDASFYDAAVSVAMSRSAHICLINFESENWFNSVSPTKKPAKQWEPWQRIASISSAIISIAEEGSRFAEDYYTIIPKQCRFRSVYPPINEGAALASKHVPKEKRILLLARFSGDHHKGGSHVAHLIGEHMKNHVLTILVGTGEVPQTEFDAITDRCAEYGVELEWRYKLSDLEKFELYNRAQLLLFPSLFEGYGYPPIEARFCGCQVIAYDLPVLRETCGDDIVLVEHNNVDAFRDALIANIDDYQEPNGHRLEETAALTMLPMK